MPTLSIVVPTRSRLDTLRHTLPTILGQNHASFEVVISDNQSDDGTEAFVRGLRDARIRYYNTGQRLSMSANWEFALSRCEGEFVTFIGDDDGFIPGGVKLAMHHLERSGLDAVIWEKAEYGWPNHIDPSCRNLCVTRLAGFTEKTINAREQLAAVCRFRECYSRLPCVYNGIIRRALFSKLTESSTDQTFFSAISPDVFSSIVLAASLDKYLFLRYPVSVNGASKHSNGTSFIHSKSDRPDAPHIAFQKENQITYPAEIAMGPSVKVCVMGELLLARNHFRSLDLPVADYRCYIHALAKEASRSSRYTDLMRSAEHTAVAMGLPMPKACPPAGSASAAQTLGLSRNVLTQKLPDIVENIFDACQVVGALAAAAAGTHDDVLSANRSDTAIASRLTRTYHKAKRHVDFIFRSRAA
jgi:hypothetical protein